MCPNQTTAFDFNLNWFHNKGGAHHWAKLCRNDDCWQLIVSHNASRIDLTIEYRHFLCTYDVERPAPTLTTQTRPPKYLHPLWMYCEASLGVLVYYLTRVLVVADEMAISVLNITNYNNCLIKLLKAISIQFAWLMTMIVSCSRMQVWKAVKDLKIESSCSPCPWFHLDMLISKGHAKTTSQLCRQMSQHAV